MPQRYNSYYECFVGGGALFFTQQPRPAFLADTNPHLITTYYVIRDNVAAVIDYLEQHKRLHSKNYYYKARDQLNCKTNAIKIAALLIYLNKTCFNGLYRVNGSGHFNVPMGNYKNPAISDIKNLRIVSNILQGVTIKQHDFIHTPICKGTFYYLDPPYHATYSLYVKDGFDDDKHKKLTDFCHRLDKANAHFMLSNYDTVFVRKLHKKFHIETISALRSVSR